MIQHSGNRETSQCVYCLLGPQKLLPFDKQIYNCIEVLNLSGYFWSLKFEVWSPYSACTKYPSLPPSCCFSLSVSLSISLSQSRCLSLFISIHFFFSMTFFISITFSLSLYHCLCNSCSHSLLILKGGVGAVLKAACLASRRSRFRAPLWPSNKKLPRSLVKIQYCGEPPWQRGSVHKGGLIPHSFNLHFGSSRNNVPVQTHYHFSGSFF